MEPYNILTESYSKQTHFPPPPLPGILAKNAMASFQVEKIASIILGKTRQNNAPFCPRQELLISFCCRGRAGPSVSSDLKEISDIMVLQEFTIKRIS